jgi:hypothetical protein
VVPLVEQQQLELGRAEIDAEIHAGSSGAAEPLQGA